MRRNQDNVSLALSRQSSSGRRSAPAFSGLRRSRCALPRLRCLRPEQTKRLARDEVALEVERVVNGCVHAEKALGRSGRLEALHLSLSSPDWQMRILSAIVLSSALAFVNVIQTENAKR